MIANDIVRAIESGRCPLLLTGRTEHLQYFATTLAGVAKHVFVLRGGMGKKQRRTTAEALASVQEDEARVILATGSYIGEGFDDARLDTLAFGEAVPRSLSDVARSLGYTGTERLYQADRSLCHKIAARYRRSGLSHWWRKPGATRICDASRLKEILEQSLNSNTPTSVHQIAASLGYANEGYICRKHPELCRAISEEIAAAKQTWPDQRRGLLENALDEQPAPTLKDLSRRLGYSSSTVLRAHEPNLCERLMARRRSNVLERRAAIERAAMAALGERPAPSLRDLCTRLGITVWFMNKYFPAVRRLVAERHRHWTSAEARQRHETLSRDVRRIAVELRSQNVYPSATKITERLPDGSCKEWKALTSAIREAQKALGVSK